MAVGSIIFYDIDVRGSAVGRIPGHYDVAVAVQFDDFPCGASGGRIFLRRPEWQTGVRIEFHRQYIECRAGI